MWAIGVLLVCGLVFFLIQRLPSQARPWAWVFVVGTVLSVPFWHHLYPSHRQFLALCEQPDRQVVLQSVSVENLFVDGNSFTGHVLSQRLGFQSFEIQRGNQGYLRFVQGDNWATPACRRDCANPGLFEWERLCEANCFTKTAIAAPTWEYRYTSEVTSLVKDRLVRRTDTALSPSGEAMATALNYVYYPYGDGWARALGLSSGSAPTLTCATKTGVWGLEFIKPVVRH
jgi:hypothetical protein